MFSDRTTIYQLNGVRSTQDRTIDRRSRIHSAIAHGSEEAIISRNCLWIGEQLLFFDAAGSLSRFGQLGDVYYWVDVICCRWNCLPPKKKRKERRNISDNSFIDPIRNFTFVASSRECKNVTWDVTYRWLISSFSLKEATSPSREWFEKNLIEKNI